MSGTEILTDGTCRGYFAGESRVFRLPVFGELRLLQDRHDIGPAGFELLFRVAQWKTAHLVDVIKYGLIGGGMPEAEADRLVRATIEAGRILRYVELAHTIILATLGPLESEEDLAKKKAAETAGEAAPASAEWDNSPMPT